MEFTTEDYLDDLRWANETMRHYEERYKMSSEEFLALYNQGKLDDGEDMAEKSEWSAACKIKAKREEELTLLERARSADNKAD